MPLYKRISVMLTMGIMAIGLITFFISGPSVYAEDSAQSQELFPVSAELTDSGDTAVGDTAGLDAVIDGNASAEATQAPAATPTPAPTPTPEPNVLLCEGVPGIHELVQSYLDAKLTCSYEAFEGIVTDPYLIDLEQLQKRTEAVSSYNDLVCYTKKGCGIIDYVVYYTYSMDIASIESPALGIDSLYVCTAEDGSYQVFLGDLDHETTLELAELTDDPEILDLINTTFAEMEAAAEADSGLLEFWERIYSED